ncbi:MAG: hypothetical protein KDK39_10155 [Leptospiraceae bacterium]|nr:hypothetical protein [Leptospiraceae bacterium]
MSSISHSKKRSAFMRVFSRGPYALLLWLLLIIGTVELFVRLAPMEQLAQTGVFLADQRSSLLEAATPTYDYIIFGESRTLSIKGHRPTPAADWSLYNFSVPAMGSHYYAAFLDKYMHHRNKAPAALIFAGDPLLFQPGWNRPLHDPDQNYTDGRNTSLSAYLWNRFWRRLQAAFGYYELHHNAGAMQEMLWSSFSHRYLHLFSLGQSWQQYHGPERLFMMYEQLPMQYYTWRWREPLAHYILGFRASYFKTHDLPGDCFQSCQATWNSACYPGIQRMQQNKLVQGLLDANQGGINLADMRDPGKRLQYMSLADSLIQADVKQSQVSSSVVDTEPLLALLETARRYQIPVVFAFAPVAKAYRQLDYYARFEQQLRDLIQARKGTVAEIVFPDRWLEHRFFVDTAHYTCEGAELVNKDFYQSVMPQIRATFPPRRQLARQGVAP